MIGYNGPVSRESRDKCELHHYRALGGGVHALVSAPYQKHNKYMVSFGARVGNVKFRALSSDFGSQRAAFNAVRSAAKMASDGNGLSLFRIDVCSRYMHIDDDGTVVVYLDPA